jgi:hypothetical protein
MGVPLPPVADTAKAQLIFSFGDDANVETILHFILPAGSFPLTSASATSLANSVMTEWAATMATIQCTAISLTNVNVTDLNTATGIEGGSTHAAVPGTVGTAPFSAGVAVVIATGTAFRGRSFRGRSYIAGTPIANGVTPQTISAAAATGIGTQFAAFITAMDGLAAPGPAQLCVVSYFSGKIPNPNLTSKNRFVPQRRVIPLTTPVTQQTARTRLGSQRRRNS